MPMEEQETQDHPLLTAATIEGLFKPSGHRLNPKCKKEEAHLSDRVGMTGLGVHIVRLPPGAHSTELHYHLNVAEWMYITIGSGTLQLLDASGTVWLVNATYRDLPRAKDTLITAASSGIEERPVGVGDFIGFRAGTSAARFAHNIIAGQEGITYLVGGTRPENDICVYPLTNTAIMFNMDEKKLLVLNKGNGGK